VTVYSKHLTSQCNLAAQIEQVQDKILFMTILLMIGSQLLYLAHLWGKVWTWPRHFLLKCLYQDREVGGHYVTV